VWEGKKNVFKGRGCASAEGGISVLRRMNIVLRRKEYPFCGGEKIVLRRGDTSIGGKQKWLYLAFLLVLCYLCPE